MGNGQFTENDWRIFRNKIAGWQEMYMDKLNMSYIELLKETAKPSEKFWKLEQRINEDKCKSGVILERKRSKLIFNIVSLIDEGAISYNDLDEFSDELKGTVRVLMGR